MNFIGQRQFDGCISEFSDAASRKSSCFEADKTPQARLISSMTTVETEAEVKDEGADTE